MCSSSLRLSSVLAAVLACASSAHADPDLHDTRLLSQPAVSAKHIAFIYADDLWVADHDGKNVRRLTSDIGIESHPVFSPDGATLAFSAQYDGNTDVYAIAVEGGAPRRLTWHPGPDTVRGFTPDGKERLLVAAPRLHQPLHAAVHRAA
jgi:tricorn protease